MSGIPGELLAGQACDLGQEARTLPRVVGFDRAAGVRNRIVAEIELHQRLDVFFRELLAPHPRDLGQAFDDPGNGIGKRIVLRADDHMGHRPVQLGDLIGRGFRRKRRLRFGKELRSRRGGEPGSFCGLEQHVPVRRAHHPRAGLRIDR